MTSDFKALVSSQLEFMKGFSLDQIRGREYRDLESEFRTGLHLSVGGEFPASVAEGAFGHSFPQFLAWLESQPSEDNNV